MDNDIKKAKERAPVSFNPNYSIPAYIAEEQRKDYIVGITEQKAIVIQPRRNYRNLYESIAESKWFADSYKGKSLGEFIEVPD